MRMTWVSWLNWSVLSLYRETVLMKQEQFLQMPDYVVENETKDQEYWYVEYES